jgi:hypothetical protein
MFVFTDPMAQYCRLSVHLRQALVRPAISAGSPSAVAVPWAST